MEIIKILYILGGIPLDNAKLIITIAILLTIVNHVVGPIFFDMEAESTATGLAVILLAIAQLNNIRGSK